MLHFGWQNHAVKLRSNSVYITRIVSILFTYITGNCFIVHVRPTFKSKMFIFTNKLKELDVLQKCIHIHTLYASVYMYKYIYICVWVLCAKRLRSYQVTQLSLRNQGMPMTKAAKHEVNRHTLTLTPTLRGRSRLLFACLRRFPVPGSPYNDLLQERAGSPPSPSAFRGLVNLEDELLEEMLQDVEVDADILSRLKLLLHFILEDDVITSY